LTTPFPKAIRRALLTCAWGLFFFCLFGLTRADSALVTEIAILKSADIAAYNQAVDGFKATLSPAATITEYDLQGDVARGRKLARKIRASSADAVLAVGLKAALVAKLEIVDIPVIFCIVLDPVKNGLAAPNMTGIMLEIPIDRQFTTMRTVLPNVKRIGVLYDPEKTAGIVEDARRHAKAAGIDVIARQIRSDKDVPTALRALLPQIDALWLIPDSTVLTEESLNFIQTTSLDSHTPVFGFSSDLVRNGALMGLSVNYEDIGRQAAAVAKRILAGQARPSSTTALVAPDRVRLSLNLKTAKFLGITIPPDVINRADELH